MSEYDVLIDQLIKHTKFTKEEIKKLVEQKKERIGAGYLTDQGALFLIASDFGISLSAIPTKKQNPLDEIKIVVVPQEELAKKCEALQTDKTRNWLHGNSFSITFFVILGSILGFTINNKEPNILILILSIIGLSGAIITIIILFKFVHTRYLEKKEINFLTFYQTYQKINEYKYRDKNYDTKKYQNAINDLADFIDSWTRSDAPSDISQLPDSLSSNLRKKIIPIFRENNQEKIGQFISSLEKIVMFCYNHEPSAQLLRAFNDEILEYEIIEIQKEIKEKSLKESILKIVWISPVSGIIVFFVLHQVDPSQIHASLGYGITTGVAILVAIVGLSKRR